MLYCYICDSFKGKLFLKLSKTIRKFLLPSQHCADTLVFSSLLNMFSIWDLSYRSKAYINCYIEKSNLVHFSCQVYKFSILNIKHEKNCFSLTNIIAVNCLATFPVCANALLAEQSDTFILLVNVVFVAGNILIRQNVLKHVRAAHEEYLRKKNQIQ